MYQKKKVSYLIFAGEGGSGQKGKQRKGDSDEGEYCGDYEQGTVSEADQAGIRTDEEFLLGRLQKEITGVPGWIFLSSENPLASSSGIHNSA